MELADDTIRIPLYPRAEFLEYLPTLYQEISNLLTKGREDSSQTQGGVTITRNIQFCAHDPQTLGNAGAYMNNLLPPFFTKMEGNPPGWRYQGAVTPLEQHGPNMYLLEISASPCS